VPLAIEVKIRPHARAAGPLEAAGPAGTASLRRRASASMRGLSPAEPRALAQAVSKTAGTSRWCSVPWSFRLGWRISAVARATGSVESLARQARSITSRAGAAWQVSHTKWPWAQATGSGRRRRRART